MLSNEIQNTRFDKTAQGQKCYFWDFKALIKVKPCWDCFVKLLFQLTYNMKCFVFYSPLAINVCYITKMCIFNNEIFIYLFFENTFRLKRAADLLLSMQQLYSLIPSI